VKRIRLARPRTIPYHLSSAGCDRADAMTASGGSHIMIFSGPAAYRVFSEAGLGRSLSPGWINGT
jgi:hypothetical protein